MPCQRRVPLCLDTGKRKGGGFLRAACIRVCRAHLSLCGAAMSALLPFTRPSCDLTVPSNRALGKRNPCTVRENRQIAQSGGSFLPLGCHLCGAANLESVAGGLPLHSLVNRVWSYITCDRPPRVSLVLLLSSLPRAHPATSSASLVRAARPFSASWLAKRKTMALVPP